MGTSWKGNKKLNKAVHNLYTGSVCHFKLYKTWLSIQFLNSNSGNVDLVSHEKKRRNVLQAESVPHPAFCPLEPRRRSKQVSTGRCIPSTEVRISVLLYWSTALMAPKTTTQRLGQTRDHSREPGVKP